MKEISRDEQGIVVEAKTKTTMCGAPVHRFDSGTRLRKIARKYFWTDIAEWTGVPVEQLREMGMRSHCYTSHTGNHRTLGTALKYINKYAECGIEDVERCLMQNDENKQRF